MLATRMLDKRTRSKNSKHATSTQEVSKQANKPQQAEHIKPSKQRLAKLDSELARIARFIGCSDINFHCARA